MYPRNFSIAKSLVSFRQINFKNWTVLYLETKDNANLIEWLWVGLWEMKVGEDSRMLEPQLNSCPEILIESRIARPKITILY